MTNGQWQNRIIGYAEVDPESVLGNPANWRIHPKLQQDALSGILSDVGLVQSIIINRRTSELWGPNDRGVETLVDGHLRVQLALSKGQKAIPAVYVDLTPAEEAEVLATIDPVAAMAVADKEQLDALLRDVQTGDAALQAMLADLAKESGLYLDAPKAKDPGAQIDKAEELREKWGTFSGQLWEVGRHRLICGDCTDWATIDRLLNGQDAATVLFDPPYDGPQELLSWRRPCKDALVFTDHRHLFDCVVGWGRFRSAFVWDGVTSWYVPGWPLARAKLALWFGGGEYDPDGAHYGEPDKAHTVTNTRGSYQYVPDPRGKHLSTVFQSPITKEFDGHKHAKPVDWVRMLIANCTQGAVLDPFLGSGTSLIACEQLGRTCLGVELEPATLAVVLERADSFGLQVHLLESVSA